ncbi:ATP-dependent DNA helicase DinG [Paenibacillus shirakamiensis]|uniref:ATP-dependent DNA helicase DinG n=1 Tax=Paenibacillus shirakamiensis TaxID=1265935 RepID=A0ABS4JHD5_9BACL|nr:ATP-dependent DNA helicase [Paenibacillus shirakamiensis]MBP2000366.1 ATP-dependent DNA helicase DinG [Paenibacillus shirakamiensis]
MERYPFDYDLTQPFLPQLGEWIADVFYDILPEAGFEVRDEQIFMAYQLERAFAEKKTIFAEAGVGTGKTLVYLLYATAYARYTRKPAIIACADESLIEQLVKPEGDISKLMKHLEFAIDARLGKSPDQYLCLVKLDDARDKEEEAWQYQEVYDELPGFVRKPETMQAFHAYGDRKNYGSLSDEQWEKISWDSFMDCFVCDRRHRCGQTLSRDYYRASSDLIICSHDYYMEHVWTYEGRKQEGQLPLLPEHSSVVFDEGHLAENAAQKALSYNLKHSIFEEIIVRLLSGEIRETLAVRIDQAIEQSEMMFELLKAASRPIPGSERMSIDLNDEVLGAIRMLCVHLDAIEEGLVFESELYTLDAYQLRIVETHLEMIQKALSLFQRAEAPICWTSINKNDLTLSIMPKTVKEVLKERVFNLNIPIVFSSATMSVDGSFAYVADSLGIQDYLSFSVNSPYDYEHQMKLYAPNWSQEGSFEDKLALAVKMLQRTEGRALILFRTKEDLQQFKAAVQTQSTLSGLRFIYEGDREISHQIADFQADEASVLCAVSLWEGLDIPGPSLSNVIIWSLPFPPLDPVILAKRQAAAKPFEEVDLPYMKLRLRQGLGRLIRTSTDEGMAAILGGTLFDPASDVAKEIAAVLPKGVTLEVLS